MSIRKILAAVLTAGLLITSAPSFSMADTAGWQGSYEDGWRYYISDSEYVKSNWKSISGKWYYFDSDGYMESNCYRDGYWLTKSGEWDTKNSHGTWKRDGTGWWYEDNGWYPVSRWLWIDGECYYFDSDGYMESECYRDGCWITKSGAWDPRYSHGVWKADPVGKWYSDNGWYPKNCSLKIDGKTYDFDYRGYVIDQSNEGEIIVNSIS